MSGSGARTGMMAPPIKRRRETILRGRKRAGRESSAGEAGTAKPTAAGRRCVIPSRQRTVSTTSASGSYAPSPSRKLLQFADATFDLHEQRCGFRLAATPQERFAGQQLEPRPGHAPEKPGQE